MSGGGGGWGGNEAFTSAIHVNLELDSLSCHCRHLTVVVLGIVTVYHPRGTDSFKMSIELLNNMHPRSEQSWPLLLGVCVCVSV